ncbi:sensor histidine kinase [Roseibacillus ishigakijimensis]|uniref:histidine kinase n=1 Tax=Roseibacillus ishigakijimensis TaxID=454146 RepID=A0A934RPR5_9BACT|nr:ATP-binding protein [Roseibacillus ishigakijimensis]MBK1833592.1 hypothetical protein [Roseibacillus ishigakijimensis]
MVRSHRRVFYRFLCLEVLLIGAVALGVLWWAGKHRIAEERRELREVGKSQAQLAGDLGLPLSGELAGHFGSLSGIEVGFRLDDGGFRTADSWSRDKLQLAWEVLEKKSGQVIASLDWIAVSYPVRENSEVRLVALKPRSRVLAMGARSEILLPVGIGALLALGSAFALARSQARLAAEEERRKEAEQMALLGKMATSMAHEVKNPAAAILMQAHSLRGGEQEEVGQMIRDDAEEIVSLVHQWLFVARPEPPRKSELDLGEMLQGLLQRLEAWAGYHRCQLRGKWKGDLRCWGDRARLEQVFRNLIQNAVQAMPGGGVVTVSLVGDEEEISFAVSDQGQGFSPAALSSFGDAFFSEREGGIGLGLALVQGVVSAHGGVVRGRNLEEGGATIEGSFMRKKMTK